MPLTDEHIAEIAELLECDVVCFFHRPTGTIDYHPETYDIGFDPELWQDTIEKIENDRENYDHFEKMDSRQGFKVMEDFAHSLPDTNFGDKLFESLSIQKPFSNFKYLVENSIHRQAWFDFRRNANIAWVKRQIRVQS